jgi:hypothetical protein
MATGALVFSMRRPSCSSSEVKIEGGPFSDGESVDWLYTSVNAYVPFRSV